MENQVGPLCLTIAMMIRFATTEPKIAVYRRAATNVEVKSTDSRDRGLEIRIQRSNPSAAKKRLKHVQSYHFEALEKSSVDYQTPRVTRGGK